MITGLPLFEGLYAIAGFSPRLGAVADAVKAQVGFPAVAKALGRNLSRVAGAT